MLNKFTNVSPGGKKHLRMDFFLRIIYALLTLLLKGFFSPHRIFTWILEHSFLARKNAAVFQKSSGPFLIFCFHALGTVGIILFKGGGSVPTLRTGTLGR